MISLSRFLGRNAPHAVVLVALAGLAYVGHRTGWKVPRLSTLRAGPRAPKEDWCPAHNVPDSRCLACHPELGGHDAKDWCKEHGVPESKCTTCHPEILTKGSAADWCKEHGVPEQGCTLCHPEIAVKSPAPVSPSGARPVLEPGAKPSKDPATCQTHVVRIQFASAESVKKAGVRLAAVEERPMSATLTANAELVLDETRVARVSPRLPGSVWRVEKEVGAAVKAGDVLALVDAVEVGRAKAELLRALAAVDLKDKVLARVQGSAASGVRTQAELLEAEASQREGRIQLFNAQQALANLELAVDVKALASLSQEQLAEHLRLLGIPEAVRRTLGGATTATLLPVRSPLDGEVIAREVVAGEVVEAGHTAFVVADLTRLRLDIDVPLADSRTVAPGQVIVFGAEGGLDQAVRGQVVWINPVADGKTRTVKIRAAVENPDRRLRAHTFGTARIVVRNAPAAITVPDEAIHWEGCCHVVFVRLTDDIFQTRKVRLGCKAGGFTEVLVGVSPGEVVATTGSHVLKSELLKSKLGPGCCE